MLCKDFLGSDTAATKDKSLRNWDLLPEALSSTYLEQTYFQHSLRVVDPHLKQRLDKFQSIFLISRQFFLKVDELASIQLQVDGWDC